MKISGDNIFKTYFLTSDNQCATVTQQFPVVNFRHIMYVMLTAVSLRLCESPAQKASNAGTVSI